MESGGCLYIHIIVIVIVFGTVFWKLLWSMAFLVLGCFG